jgi:site-specific DNA-methyltransferase (adenine-specific)
MEAMRAMPDKCFDLAIVDPPYGIGMDWKKRNKVSDGRFADTSYKNDSIPSKEYFEQLIRISIDQIIWGWNYYTVYLGSTNYLICWDKQSASNGVFKYSQFELAYTSKRMPAQIVSIPWDGYRMGSETGVSKIHPHQKPVKLYEWLLKNYAKQGDRILDTHLGSGSSRIAADKMGFEFTGYELDTEYFDLQEKRFADYKSQLNLFDQ